MAKKGKGKRRTNEILDTLSTDIADASTQEVAYIMMLNADLIGRSRARNLSTPLSGDDGVQDAGMEDLITHVMELRAYLTEDGPLFFPPLVFPQPESAMKGHHIKAQELFNKAYEVAYLQALKELKGDI